MRTKHQILEELGKNRQPGMYGGIPPDTKDSILIEVLIDIRDVLVKWIWTPTPNKEEKP